SCARSSVLRNAWAASLPAVIGARSRTENGIMVTSGGTMPADLGAAGALANAARKPAFLPPLQGEGRGGDGFYDHPHHPHPYPPLEGEGSNAAVISWRFDANSSSQEISRAGMPRLPRRQRGLVTLQRRLVRVVDAGHATFAAAVGRIGFGRPLRPRIVGWAGRRVGGAHAQGFRSGIAAVYRRTGRAAGALR